VTGPEAGRDGGAGALAHVLSALSLPRDRVVYIHSSVDWLARAGIRTGGALEALLEWVDHGGGTLAFPAFPFRGAHEVYLRSEPVFDVRRSPARVGLLNETLRRHRGVKRSLDPDLSVIAFGPRADAVVGSGFTGADPTGPDSPFQRIIDLDGVFLGLGVSLNYMNLIHVLDSRYRHRYPFPIYSRSLYVAHTIDAAGRRHRVAKHAILSDLQAHIKPSRIALTLQPGRETFRSLTICDTSFFLWDLPLWEPLCVAHLEQALDANRVPCWLTEVERHMAARPARDDVATTEV
jgi:aminoglycoside N3'-acetyltransferase